MTFQRKKIWGEQLEQLAGLVEPLLEELDLDLPIKQESTLLIFIQKIRFLKKYSILLLKHFIYIKKEKSGKLPRSFIITLV